MKFIVISKDYVEVTEEDYKYRLNISTEEKRIMAAEHIFFGLPMDDSRDILDIYNNLTVPEQNQ